MKTSKEIPKGKLRRAGKILKTGLKVGKNYAGFYGAKLFQSDTDRNKLDEQNASDIMDSLLELKGGGLKVAQMLSMEKSLLPKAYADKFSLAQFSVPPLSAPLVKKTFRKYWGKNPEELFDSFDYEATFAASIGQVHKATLKGKTLAVKIQYPGVADSIDSDLAVIKPIAYKILRLSNEEADKYFQEVKQKLLEETDYELELANSQQVTEACMHLPEYIFPKYYPELSSSRIITMDWIDGQHLPEYAASDINQEQRNRIGQKIWDLFIYQIITLGKVHADPHPGNILITPTEEVCVLDFGCIKEIPSEFLEPFIELTQPGIIEDDSRFEDLLFRLEILKEDDSPEEKEYYYALFQQMLKLLLRPYHTDSWDFSDQSYFDEITQSGEKIAKETLFSSYRVNRGSEHFIYMNRTFFGLYQLMNVLGAEIKVDFPSNVMNSIS